MTFRTSLKRTVAPTSEPVALAEAKAWVKQDNDADDALISSLIVAAREAAEQYLRRSLITQTYRLSLDLMQDDTLSNLPAGVYDMPISSLYSGLPKIIELPMPEIISVTSVTTYNTANTGTVYSSSNYFVDTDAGRVVLNQDAIWPGSLRISKAVEIVYVAGYGTAAQVPRSIRTSILMHLETMYNGRRECEIPAACEQILKKYKIYGTV
jgi:hypothetical protein